MKKQDLMESLGEVDEVWLSEAARAKRRNTSKPLFVIAAALLLAFSFALGAFAATAVLQAEPPEEPEQETGDFYVPPKHVVYDPQNPENTTFELIKLYADAVTAQAVFRLTLPEGTHLSPDVRFSLVDATVYYSGEHSDEEMTHIRTETEIISVEKNAVCFRLLFTCRTAYPSSGKNALYGSRVRVEYSDLRVSESVFFEGTWQAQFDLPIDFESVSYHNLPVAEKVVTALPEGWKIQGAENTVHETLTLRSMPEITVTPMSVHIVYTFYSKDIMKIFDAYVKPWELCIVLEDGTTVNASPINRGHGAIDSTKTSFVSEDDTFCLKEPIDPEQVVALIWGDLTIDLRE